MWAHPALGNLRQLDDEIDDLVLKNWCPQTGHGFRVLAIEIKSLAFIALVAADFAGNRLVQLVLRDGNVVSVPDLRKQQAEPNTPLSDLAVLGFSSLVAVLAGGLPCLVG